MSKEFEWMFLQRITVYQESHVNRYSTSLVMRKVQIESTTRYHFTHSKMATENNKCHQECKVTGTLCAVCVNVKGIATGGKRTAVPQKGSK